ncbi:hypothetical protein ARMGADRAFT_1037655 [Armillaria gallica]|uniref:Uncharacterized protein n=1 Tax=Armillaria gallica TaxID=47427 RepID=A0A2H3CWT3_ARMGA|nr:hypothetical protein ARMGADRAFT_1037655 [Armillaria gallica]
MRIHQHLRNRSDADMKMTSVPAYYIGYQNSGVAPGTSRESKYVSSGADPPGSVHLTFMVTEAQARVSTWTGKIRDPPASKEQRTPGHFIPTLLVAFRASANPIVEPLERLEDALSHGFLSTRCVDVIVKGGCEIKRIYGRRTFNSYLSNQYVHITIQPPDRKFSRKRRE